VKNSEPRVQLSNHARIRGLVLILFLGSILFFWQLGATGLVDETPPLFAAAGRAMSATGDWLTPRVNGLNRFDKPPLIYWLMGFVYSLPRQEFWDPLGTWAARFPSALSSLLLMLAIGDTVMLWPQSEGILARRAGVATSLLFALSPLVMVWSRIAVSDALLCSTLGISLLCHWRRYADQTTQNWWIGWVFLGLAVLTKGPVAIVLSFMTIGTFLLLSKTKPIIFISKIKPIKGLLISASICLPWYLLELVYEGKAFWNSFFGYHNFQRFTSVVNSHQEPFWFFFLVLIISSLPFTPLLFSGFIDSLRSLNKKYYRPENSLAIYASSWLISVFVLFTFSATKLPSYWLPAVPAAALLTGIASFQKKPENRYNFFLYYFVGIISAVLSLVFFVSPLWVVNIYDPEMPGMADELLNSGLLVRAGFFFGLTSLLSFFIRYELLPRFFIFLQLPIIFFQTFVFVPLMGLADQIRQLPLRQVSDLILTVKKINEPLIMAGIVKPSIHFYTNQIVFYAGNTSRNLLNVTERIYFENRKGWKNFSEINLSNIDSVLVIIDTKTSNLQHWTDLEPQNLGEFGIYKVWRLKTRKLKERADKIKLSGVKSNWRIPKPERL